MEGCQVTPRLIRKPQDAIFIQAIEVALLYQGSAVDWRRQPQEEATLSSHASLENFDSHGSRLVYVRGYDSP
jgi:hypothetical protein